MRLATRHDGSKDGQLLAISADGERYLAAGNPWNNLREALENWTVAESGLLDTAKRLEQGEGEPLDTAQLAAPLPRAWQWLDGSVFQTHADLMQVAFGHEPIIHEKPLMYQGLSDRFHGPEDDVPFVSETDGIDFEGEFGIVTDAVSMGTPASAALGLIRLIVQINDWSLRNLAVPEMKSGFGWVQAKPACSIAPYAVTPDELGDDWRDGRVCLDLEISVNGEKFGRANGREMAFGFHELVAHAAATRDLPAGTVIGSGTVANADYAQVGSSCISERRAIEIIAHGKPQTGFLRFGDSVQMAGRNTAGHAPFGIINQKVANIGSIAS